MPKKEPKKTLFIRLYEEDGDIVAFLKEADCTNEAAYVKSLIRLGIHEMKNQKNGN